MYVCTQWVIDYFSIDWWCNLPLIHVFRSFYFHPLIRMITNSYLMMNLFYSIWSWSYSIKQTSLLGRHVSKIRIICHFVSCTSWNSFSDLFLELIDLVFFFVDQWMLFFHDFFFFSIGEEFKLLLLWSVISSSILLCPAVFVFFTRTLFSFHLLDYWRYLDTTISWDLVFLSLFFLSFFIFFFNTTHSRFLWCVCWLTVALSVSRRNIETFIFHIFFAFHEIFSFIIFTVEGFSHYSLLFIESFCILSINYSLLLFMSISRLLQIVVTKCLIIILSSSSLLLVMFIVFELFTYILFLSKVIHSL